MFKREKVLRRTKERKREREREGGGMCACFKEEKKEDDCDEINCRGRFFLRRKCFSEIASRVKKDKEKRWVRENFYMIKGSTFVRSLQTNNV